MSEAEHGPTVRVDVDDEQLVRRVVLSVGRTAELNLEFLQLVVLMQVLGAESTLLAPAPEVATGFPPLVTRLATPALTDRALQLAERVLEAREPSPEVARGDRTDVVVTTTGARVTGLDISPAWASRVNPLDLAARLALRLREAQQACRREASGNLDAEVAGFVDELIDITEGR